MKKRIIILVLILIIALQFFRPTKNLSKETGSQIGTRYAISGEVSDILKNACNDCHSNFTRYPWYADFQPVGWWMSFHINDGKRHLNFSEFTSRPAAIQYHKFEETVEMVKEKEMPLKSYTNFGMHPEAHITDAQRQLLVSWAETQMDSLKSWYPPDSLIMRRRPR